MKILLVDDEEVVIVTTRRFLEDLGHDVLSTEDIGFALYSAKQFPFDALITDFQMPGQNGLELIEELRANGSCPPRVILMSGDQLDNLPDGVVFFKKAF